MSPELRRCPHADFKAQRYIADNFYRRGDGTLVYFFTPEELDDLFTQAGLIKRQNHVDKRLVVNRAKQVKMYRRWMQCKYVKEPIKSGMRLESECQAYKQNKRQLLRLCCETLKHRPYIEKVLSVPSVSKTIARGGLAHVHKSEALLPVVLAYEVLFSKQTKGDKMVKKLLGPAYEAIKNEDARLRSEGVTPESTVAKSRGDFIPRYVRVNTLKASFDDVTHHLEADGWTVVRLKPKISPSKYRKLVAALKHPKVYVDPHVENLLIFPKDTDLHDWELAREGALVLQDKASCLSAFVLSPEPSSSAMDVCAAPGMKTSHLAAIMQNKGVIHAFDKDPGRANTLKEMLEKAGATMATARQQDFLRVYVVDKRYADVEYVIVDPPCSGSGIVKRGDYLDESEVVDEKRIRKLANIQAMLLKHALKLPNIKRLVYSTCSIHEMENEGVVAEALSEPSIAERFELVDPLPTWRHRGVASCEFGEKCLRADPETDLTNGFFVALFQAK
ncbi:Protein Y53F4B.4 b [Aphelenchoides avenae]|nr:Protein Y53F4B.4 b [Aphelenchus avenae]